MKIAMTRTVGRFVKKRFMSVVIFIIALLAGFVSYADVPQDVNRLFELHAKFLPGTTIEALKEMLGPPEENHALGGKASDVIRYSWLQDGLGIEVYEVEGVAYRVAITMPCGSDKDQGRAMDALTQQGKSKYGSWPQSDPQKNEYYWVKDGIRFAFSRYNKTTVLSSCTKTH